MSDLSGVTSEMVSLYINLSSVPWACLRQDAGRCVFGSSSLSKGNKELPVCGDPRCRQNFHGRPSSLRPHEACELWTGQGRLGPDGHAVLSELRFICPYAVTARVWRGTDLQGTCHHVMRVL